jgi:hypothetical protein
VSRQPLCTGCRFEPSSARERFVEGLTGRDGRWCSSPQVGPCRVFPSGCACSGCLRTLCSAGVLLAPPLGSPFRCCCRCCTPCRRDTDRRASSAKPKSCSCPHSFPNGTSSTAESHFPVAGRPPVGDSRPGEHFSSHAAESVAEVLNHAESAGRKASSSGRQEGCPPGNRCFPAQGFPSKFDRRRAMRPCWFCQYMPRRSGNVPDTSPLHVLAKQVVVPFPLRPEKDHLHAAQLPEGYEKRFFYPALNLPPIRTDSNRTLPLLARSGR